MQIIPLAHVLILIKVLLPKFLPSLSSVLVFDTIHNAIYFSEQCFEIVANQNKHRRGNQVKTATLCTDSSSSKYVRRHCCITFKIRGLSVEKKKDYFSETFKFERGLNRKKRLISLKLKFLPFFCGVRRFMAILWVLVKPDCFIFQR